MKTFLTITATLSLVFNILIMKHAEDLEYKYARKTLQCMSSEE